MGKSLENAPTLPDLSYLIRGLCLTIPRHFAKCTLNHDIFIADTFGRCFSTTTVISTSPSPQTIHLPSTSTVNAYSPVGVIAAMTPTASTSDDFALTRPNSIISNWSTSSGCYTSSTTASTTTPQHSITCDDDGGGIVRVSG